MPTPHLSPVGPAGPAATPDDAVFRAVVESSLDVITVLSPEGRIRYASPATRYLLGYAPEELVGRNSFELVHPEDVALALQLLSAALAEIEAIPSPLRFRDARGGWRLLECTGRPLRGQGDRQPALVVTSRDVGGRTRTLVNALERQRALEENVRRQAAALADVHLEMLRRLAHAAECRDDETGQHIRRVAELAAALAKALGMSRDEVELVRSAAPLHDVGKIGIRDAILLKPGPLTAEETAVMRTHTTLGARLLQNGRSQLVHVAETVALSHHERWDGGGYPAGLRAAEIPRAARVVAVADYFDALTHARPYRAAVPQAQAVAALREERGRAFEPAVVDAFLDLPDAARLTS